MAPKRYAGVTVIANWLGVTPQLVSKWLSRYEGTDTPTPEPDVIIEPGPRNGGDAGWDYSRRREWEQWHASRPGRGAPGRPRGRAG